MIFRLATYTLKLLSLQLKIRSDKSWLSIRKFSFTPALLMTKRPLKFIATFLTLGGSTVRMEKGQAQQFLASNFSTTRLRLQENQIK